VEGVEPVILFEKESQHSDWLGAASSGRVVRVIRNDGTASKKHSIANGVENCQRNGVEVAKNTL